MEVIRMDPVSAARTARESLARGLSALQTPGIPPALMAVADPVAQAMSALHRIEASGGGALAEAAPYALACVRQALGLLQSPGVSHPAVDSAMEAIAGSLGVVHQLSVSAAPAPAPVSPYAGTQMMDQSLFQAPAVAAPRAGNVAPAQGYPPAPVYGAPPRPQAPPPAAPVAQAAPPAAVAAQAPAAGLEAFPPGLPRVEAALGAHSPTNFYKGLSSNDIIESGGIFIATYKIPKVGSQVVVHLSLPGGYEFDALAIVRWAREAPDASAGQAPPGFGAQFVQISPEGRQLVYRYVRNREPLFHDDL
ncbi:MAG TPA: PilZ domain-containing protein [Polyangiaceae bacterium]|nr:PilZ domain-containing protein [Polyangiaceae bacterium]